MRWGGLVVVAGSLLSGCPSEPTFSRPSHTLAPREAGRKNVWGDQRFHFEPTNTRDGGAGPACFGDDARAVDACADEPNFDRCVSDQLGGEEPLRACAECLSPYRDGTERFCPGAARVCVDPALAVDCHCIPPSVVLSFISNEFSSERTHGNDLMAPCGGSAGPDIAYLFTADVAGTYRVSTAGSEFDTVLYVTDSASACEVGTILACNDDTPQVPPPADLCPAAGKTCEAACAAYSQCLEPSADYEACVFGCYNRVGAPIYAQQICYGEACATSETEDISNCLTESPASEDCTNGTDDDGDNTTDCEDIECMAVPACRELLVCSDDPNSRYAAICGNACAVVHEIGLIDPRFGDDRAACVGLCLADVFGGSSESRAGEWACIWAASGDPFTTERCTGAATFSTVEVDLRGGETVMVVVDTKEPVRDDGRFTIRFEWCGNVPCP